MPVFIWNNPKFVVKLLPEIYISNPEHRNPNEYSHLAAADSIRPPIVMMVQIDEGPESLYLRVAFGSFIKNKSGLVETHVIILFMMLASVSNKFTR